MALFDANGNPNRQHQAELFGQAASQVTGGGHAAPSPVFIVGAGRDWLEVPPAGEEMISELRQALEPALKQGADPNTPVMVSLWQVCQLARSFEWLSENLEEAEAKLIDVAHDAHDLSSPDPDFGEVMSFVESLRLPSPASPTPKDSANEEQAGSDGAERHG